MNAAPFPSLTPHELARLLWRKKALILAPALVGGVLAAAYSLVMPRYWEASQGLVVRQETAGARGPTPGKFADLYEMRTLQETILEVAKSQQVVVGTLKAVNQELNGSAGEPDAEEIDKFREHLKMLPPHGGEFGKTEVFYFYMKDPDRKRAIALVGELCRQLDLALKQLRTERAQSLVAELQQQVDLATTMNADQTAKLAELEKQVGADLGELRMLHSGSSGQSDLRTELVQLESDLRKFQTQVREAGALISLLEAAQQDPLQLIATPNSLLTTQPALRQLKDGLIKAQITTAQLSGTRSDEHPQVQAAIESEQQIRNDLHRELKTAVSGAEVEKSLAEQRVTATETRLHALQGRLVTLAEQRAEYANRIAAVDNSRATLNQARHNLSTAKAAEAAAQGASLVTRIGAPETGPRPVGPGRTIIALAGAVGGGMLGVALVFFTAVGAPHESTSSVVGVRPAPSPTVPYAPAPAPTPIPMRRAETFEPAPTREHMQPAEQFAAATAAGTSAMPRSGQTWDVEVRPPAEHWSGLGTNAELAAASKHLLGTSRASAAPATSATATATAPVATMPERKPSLPLPPGALPSALGNLPSGGFAGAPAMSLQEAIQVAKQSAN